MYYHNIGAVGTKEVTMTDIAMQCTIHDNTSGNVHVITVQSIITFIYATCTFTLKHFIKYTHMYILYVIYRIFSKNSASFM